MIRRVNLTTARNLSPIYDEVVGEEHPVVITRGRREQALLVSRDQALRLLRPYRFHVDIIPEEEGGFTLWLKELNLGEHGPTLQEARSRLLEAVRAYAQHYVDSWDFYRHLPDRAAQEPYVHRISLAEDDREMIDMLFESAEAPEPAGAGRHEAHAPA